MINKRVVEKVTMDSKTQTYQVEEHKKTHKWMSNLTLHFVWGHPIEKTNSGGNPQQYL